MLDARTLPKAQHKRREVQGLKVSNLGLMVLSAIEIKLKIFGLHRQVLLGARGSWLCHYWTRKRIYIKHETT